MNKHTGHITQMSFEVYSFKCLISLFSSVPERLNNIKQMCIRYTDVDLFLNALGNSRTQSLVFIAIQSYGSHKEKCTNLPRSTVRSLMSIFFVFLGEVAALLEGQANHAPLSKESEILGFDQSSCQRIASILSPY